MRWISIRIALAPGELEEAPGCWRPPARSGAAPAHLRGRPRGPGCRRTVGCGRSELARSVRPIASVERAMALVDTEQPGNRSMASASLRVEQRVAHLVQPLDGHAVVAEVGRDLLDQRQRHVLSGRCRSFMGHMAQRRLQRLVSSTATLAFAGRGSAFTCRPTRPGRRCFPGRSGALFYRPARSGRSCKREDPGGEREDHHRAVPDQGRRADPHDHPRGAARADRERRLQPLPAPRRGRADRPAHRLGHLRR